MEIIIGRDQDSAQLCVYVGGKPNKVGLAGSVPGTVSRKHLSLTLNADGSFLAKNIKVQNSTWVNGILVNSKNVTTDDVVELGPDRYRLNWAELEKVLPATADIRHLEEVWNEYNNEMLSMTVKQNRFNALRAGTSIITMIAIVAATFGPKGSLYFLLYGIAITASIVFFIKSFIDASRMPVKRHKLQEEFQHNYTCPKCGKFLGNQSYEQLRLYDNCPNPSCRIAFKK